jgi:hypothetical protein
MGSSAVNVPVKGATSNRRKKSKIRNSMMTLVLY